MPGNGEKRLGQEHVPLLPSGLSALLKPDPGVSVEVPPEMGSHPPKQSHESVTQFSVSGVGSSSAKRYSGWDNWPRRASRGMWDSDQVY